MSRFFQVTASATFPQIQQVAALSTVPTRLLLQDMSERGEVGVEKGEGREKLYHSNLIAMTPQWKAHTFMRNDGYKQLMEFVKESPNLTRPEIERRLEHAVPPAKRSTTRHRLKRLVEENVIMETPGRRKPVYSLRPGVDDPLTFDLGERDAIEAERTTQFALLIESVGTVQSGLQNVIKVSFSTLRLYEHQGAAAVSGGDLERFAAAMEAFEASTSKSVDERKLVTSMVLGTAGDALRRAATGLQAKLPG